MTREEIKEALENEMKRLIEINEARTTEAKRGALEAIHQVSSNAKCILEIGALLLVSK